MSAESSWNKCLTLSWGIFKVWKRWKYQEFHKKNAKILSQRITNDLMEYVFVFLTAFIIQKYTFSCNLFCWFKLLTVTFKILSICFFHLHVWNIFAPVFKKKGFSFVTSCLPYLSLTNSTIPMIYFVTNFSL